MNPKLTPFLFYLLSFTWGLPFTLLGCIAAVFFSLRGYRPQKWGYCYCFAFGKNWGGMNLGIFFFCGENSTPALKNHEHGHAVQNCYLGPFMIPVIALPSLIRSRYRNHLITKKHIDPKTLPPYDSIWFEGGATKLGNALISYIHLKK